MTTPMPAVGAPVTEVCRVTVDGPTGRADLVIPVNMAIATLLPVLLRQAGLPDERNSVWNLQRLGEEPLDPAGTPRTLGWRHGELLLLREAEDTLPPLHFDDLADGVAHVVSGQSGRWRPESTRWLSLVSACLALLALAVGLVAAGSGAGTGAASGAVALLLGFGCVAAARLPVSKDIALIAGTGSLAFGVLAGLLSRSGTERGDLTDVTALMLAVGWVAVLATALLTQRTMPFAVPGTALLTALCVAVVCGLREATDWHGGQAVALVAFALFAFGYTAPRFALRLARLRLPHLPHDAEELQQDIEPQPEDLVRSRVLLAGALLDSLAVSSAVVCLAAWWFLTHLGGWIGWVLPLVFGTALLLRARHLTGVAQRVSGAVAGGIGLTAVLLVRFAPQGPGARLVVLAILLITAALLLVASVALPAGRLLPIWGRLGEIGEILTAVALLPLLLKALNAYAYFRSMAG